MAPYEEERRLPEQWREDSDEFVRWALSRVDQLWWERLEPHGPKMVERRAVYTILRDLAGAIQARHDRWHPDHAPGPPDPPHHPAE